MPSDAPNPNSDADRNWRLFVWFRVLFGARFYYPVMAVLFLDLGLGASEFTLLNFVWALAIVACDLPAGVLADRIGRRPLVIAASISMVVEMILLAVAPRNGGAALLICCLANRLLSGAAEGMASGADEALVFDSLAERNRQDEWPRVLDQVTRWQSLGFVVAMLVGGVVYDAGFLNRIFGTHFDQATTLRFPLYLNLLSAVATVVVAIGLREPARETSSAVASPGDEGKPSTSTASAFKHLFSAGGWIARTPLALFAIVAGVMLDGAARVFMTLSSSYYRLIELPAVIYGIIGAALGLMGLAVGPAMRWLVTRMGPARNYAILAVVSLIGLIGAALRWHWWGVIFMIPLWGGMSAVQYLMSYYLNATVDSDRRATVLSFKGMAVNLNYGFVSLAFAGLLRALRDGGDPEATFGRALPWLPVWLAVVLIIVAIAFWRRDELSKIIHPAPAN